MIPAELVLFQLIQLATLLLLGLGPNKEQFCGMAKLLLNKLSTKLLNVQVTPLLRAYFFICKTDIIMAIL